MSWLAYDLTGSGSSLGLVNGMRVIPNLFVTPSIFLFSSRMRDLRLSELRELGRQSLDLPQPGQ
jgi:hypothetical protein